MTLFLFLALMGNPSAIVRAADPTSSSAASDDLAQQKVQAMEQVARGDFKIGAASLGEVLKQSPDDSASVQANTLLSGYMELRAEDEKERRVEYQQAVDKAELLMKAIQARPTSAKVAQARESIIQARKVYAEMITVPQTGVLEGQKPYAQRVPADLAKMREFIQKGVLALSDEPAAYVECVQQAIGKLSEAMTAYEATVAGQAWDTTASSLASAEAIKTQTDDLSDLVDTLTSLVTELPIRAALDQARLAKEIALDKDKVLTEGWVKGVIAEAQTQAKSCESRDEWYKALTLYSGLAELVEQDKSYKLEVRKISRHARVLAMYGPADLNLSGDQAGTTTTTSTSAPTTATSGASQEKRKERENKWKDFVAGVDTRMVKSAISELEEKYVDNVDYRKVLLGALNAIKILAETPQLASTFPGLADEQARAEFIQSIDGQIEATNEKDVVQHLNISLALDRVQRVNRQTVKIPSEVIDVEFGDGMLQELDQFSSLIWPSDWPDFRKVMVGNFSGVGIQIQVENGLLKVISPLEDSPAYRAGIHAGDFIVAIDGKIAENVEIDEAVKRITGAQGSKVTLTIRRPGRDAQFDVTLVRDEIHIQTVKGWKRIQGDRWDWMLDPQSRIGYIRMSSFTRDTAPELHKALQDLKSQGVRGVILDLRFDPGGLLISAAEVTDEFVSEGKIVSTQGRQEPRKDMNATEGGAYLTGDLVVLVNGLSASAAEIVSGALKDLGRATVIGTRSFGKGSVQNLIPIRQDQAFLKLTTAYYYLPSGRCLHRTEDATTWGVEPDINVPITPEQTRRWLDLRRQTDIIQDRQPGDLDKEMVKELRSDTQLNTALLVLRMKQIERKLDQPVAKNVSK